MHRRGNRSAPAGPARKPDSAAGKCPSKKPCRERPLACLAAKLQKRTRVQLYLPIADLPVNVFLILAMGAAVGFVSGMFGIGGGFLITPPPIFIRIPPPGPAPPPPPPIPPPSPSPPPPPPPPPPPH